MVFVLVIAVKAESIDAIPFRYVIFLYHLYVICVQRMGVPTSNYE